MKKALMAVAAVCSVLGSTAVMADPGDPPTPTEKFLSISRYYNQSSQLVGWDITYCDFTVESYRAPGAVLYTIETEDGACL